MSMTGGFLEKPGLLRMPSVWQRVPGTGLFVMSVLIVVFGFYVFYPLVLILITSFNVARIGEPFQYSLANWRVAFLDPAILRALFNTILVYFLYTSISFPVATLTAWLLARTKMPFSHGLEFMFWISWMLPPLSVITGWILLLDGDVGLVNVLFRRLGFTEGAVFNIFSVEGIVFGHLMSNAISVKVMLMTPAFRNMDAALEEAASVSGASRLRTMIRVTFPVMTPILSVVFLLNTVRMFQSFEIEQILGKPIRFFVFSTLIHDYARGVTPQQGHAAALGSLTILVIAVIVPLQRWLLARRRYTTVTGQFRPGLIDLGALQPVAVAAVALLAAALTVVPIVTLLFGSFMTRVGFFEASPTYTLDHYRVVFTYPALLRAMRNTLILGFSAGIVGPLLFAVVAYILLRTRWPGRLGLDAIFWMSAGIPGMLTGLGLMWMFLGVPVLVPVYGTIFALVLVVIMQGQLLGTQVFKAAFLQIGSDLEDAARVSGGSAVYTFSRIWLPLVSPTMVTVGTFQFVLAISTLSNIVLLAGRDTKPLSLVILELLTENTGAQVEQAGILSLFLACLAIAVALLGRACVEALGVRHSSERTVAEQVHY